MKRSLCAVLMTVWLIVSVLPVAYCLVPSRTAVLNGSLYSVSNRISVPLSATDAAVESPSSASPSSSSPSPSSSSPSPSPSSPSSEAASVADSRQSAEVGSAWPLPGGRITSSFGFRRHPILRRRIFHEGVDIAASFGQPIHCVFDGIVRSSGYCGGFGRTVVVYHPSSQTTTYYGHMSRLAVRAGQLVRRGDIVGFAGSTGLSTGVHLHFGVKSSGGCWIDPVAFVSSCCTVN